MEKFILLSGVDDLKEKQDFQEEKAFQIEEPTKTSHGVEEPSVVGEMDYHVQKCHRKKGPSRAPRLKGEPHWKEP